MALLSAVVTLAGYVPYVRLILMDATVKPNRASWFVWWVIDCSMAFVTFSAHEWSAFALFGCFSIGTTTVLALSLKKGEGQFSRSDMFYVLLALVGIILWRTSDNIDVSIVANMFAATMGTLPTIKKSYHDPESEDQLTWMLFWVGGLLNTLAITNWTFVSAAPTVCIWIMQWGINFGLILGRRKKKE